MASECKLCGTSGVPLRSWRVGTVESGGLGDTRQVPLCEYNAAPFRKLQELSDTKERVAGECVQCGAPAVGRWRVELAPSRTEPGKARRVWLCQTCAAPISTVLNLVELQRDYAPLPETVTISQLIPTRALYAQRNSGQEPPEELMLK